MARKMCRYCWSSNGHHPTWCQRPNQRSWQMNPHLKNTDTKSVAARKRKRRHKKETA